MNSSVSKPSIPLDYVEYGNRLAMPVLFLHGYTDSRRSFDRLLDSLPNSIHAVTVSLRGHGDSRPENGYTADDFAADVIALMDRMGFARAVIVGHSMGATVAQRMALSYPERIVGVVLIASFYSLKDNQNAQQLWESVVSRLEDPIDPQIVWDFQSSTVASVVPMAFLDLMVQESLKLPASRWKQVLRDQLAADFAHELDRIQVPVLLLWGDQDTFVTRGDQDQLLAALPTVNLSVYNGVGHSPHWEFPERCASEIHNFVFQFDDRNHGYRRFLARLVGERGNPSSPLL
jgi:pimeloyl-ACP methyl ester carboxylesterase